MPRCVRSIDGFVGTIRFWRLEVFHGERENRNPCSHVVNITMNPYLDISTTGDNPYLVHIIGMAPDDVSIGIFARLITDG